MLIQAIKSAYYQFEGLERPYLSLYDVKKILFNMRQTKDISGNMDDQQGKRAHKERVGKYRGNIIPWRVSALCTKFFTKEKFLVMGMLRSEDIGRHGKLLEEKDNNFNKGSDYWNKTVSEYYCLFVNNKHRYSLTFHSPWYIREGGRVH